MRIFKAEYIDLRSFKHKTVNVLADSKTAAAAWVKSRYHGMIVDIREV